MKPQTVSSSAYPAATVALPVAQQAPVLLVEDDEPLRRYLETVLQRAGYQVVTAVDGLAAMKIVLSQPVQAIITDAIMPYLSGHELCRFLRRHPKLTHLPLIMLSGLTESQTNSGLPETPDLCLAKPVRGEDLLEHLAGLLRQRAA
jgi:DNA-binding response OmpR family regulator